jgi:hypothetical protein
MPPAPRPMERTDSSSSQVKPAPQQQFTFVVASSNDRTRRAHELQISTIKAHAARTSRLSKSNMKAAGEAGQGEIHATAKRASVPLVGSSKAAQGRRRSAPVSSAAATTTTENARRAMLAPAPALPKALVMQGVDLLDSVAFDGPGSIDGVTQFVVAYNVPTLRAVNAAFGLGNVYDKFMLTQMRGNPDLTHAMVACMKAARDVLGRPGGAVSKDVLIHKSRAMTLFRRRLGDPESAISDSAILTVLFLSMLESSLGDREACHIHQSQLHRMIWARGGTSRVNAARGLLAAATQAAPLTEDAPKLTYPEQPLPRAYRALVANLPSGFLALAYTGTLSWEATAVLVRVARTQNASQGKDGPTRGGDGATSMGPDQFPPGPADYHAAAPGLLLRDDDVLGPSIEHLLQLALVRLLINASGQDRIANGVFHSVTTYLTERIVGVDISRLLPPERDVLRWMFLVTIDSWLVGVPASTWHEIAQEAWYLRREMLSKLPETQAWSPEEWEALGRRFFWNDGLGRVALLPVPG